MDQMSSVILAYQLLKADSEYQEQLTMKIQLKKIFGDNPSA